MISDCMQWLKCLFGSRSFCILTLPYFSVADSKHLYRDVLGCDDPAFKCNAILLLADFKHSLHVAQHAQHLVDGDFSSWES